MSAANDLKVIGYFAYASPIDILCDGDACIIAGSDVDLKNNISKFSI
jgi:hypothetical protein